jgi:hypothetical protein
MSREGSAISFGDTIVPMGTAQTDVRTAYHDILSHLYGGRRSHWTAAYHRRSF